MRDPSPVAGDRTLRILVMTLGPETGTSARQFRELSALLSENHTCRSKSISLSGRSMAGKALSILGTNLRHLRDVVWSDTVIVHVPAALSFPLLLMARLLGRRIVIFQWDVYPVTLSGQLYATNPMRRIAHAAAHLCLRLAQ